jgi:hypothetical protein
MICPKCGRPVTEAAVICPGCDFILDTGFLGEEILDEEKTLRPGRGGVDPAMFNLADAVILGDIDDSAQSFETSDSGFHVRESTGARLYVSGRSQALLAPDAIPAIIQAASKSGVRLTPFERHVLTFIDGSRPVETIRQIAGLDESEVKTALATLADKGVVEVVGRALVELGEDASPRLPRRPQSRGQLRRQIAGAFGPVEDEADAALEEAFRTQTGLSPLNADELAPSGDDDDGDVFSHEGSGEGSGEDFVSESETNELASLASSSTPVAAVERRARTTSFAPVSRTADPPSVSRESDDGFDEFGGASAFGATQRVTLRSVGSSSDLSDVSNLSGELASPTGADPPALASTKNQQGTASSTPADGIVRDSSSGFEFELVSGAEYDQVPPGSALAELSALDDDIDLPGMGQTAIARIANSALGFPVARKRGGREPRTQATMRVDGDKSRRLLSEAVDGRDGADPLLSLAEAPSLPSEPRPPFLSSSASGIEVSAEGDDFSGDEYSDDGEPTATPLVRPPTVLSPVGDRGATDSLLSALSEQPEVKDQDEIDTGVVHKRPKNGIAPPPTALFTKAPVDDAAASSRHRPSTEPSLDLSLRDRSSDLLGSALMRSAADVQIDGGDPALASDAPTGPVVSRGGAAIASTSAPSSLVIDDVVDDPFDSDLGDDDAPTAIRPPQDLPRPRDAPKTAISPQPSAVKGASLSSMPSGFSDLDVDLGPDVADRLAPRDESSSGAGPDDDPSLDALSADRERQNAIGVVRSVEGSGRVKALPERPPTARNPPSGVLSSLASKSPAPEMSDDDDPALSGLIEGVADLSMLRMAPDFAAGEAFASPPLRREGASELGPDTIGVRSDVFTSSPGDPAHAIAGGDTSTLPQQVRSPVSDDDAARTQLLRPQNSERAVRRDVDGDRGAAGGPRRSLRIGAADSAEHTALRDVPIRDEVEEADHENEGSGVRRPSVVSSARALSLDDSDENVVPGEDHERTIGRAVEPPRAPALRAKRDPDDGFDAEVPTDAVEAMRAQPSSSMHVDESEPSAMASVESALSDDDLADSAESGMSELSGLSDDDEPSHPSDDGDFVEVRSGETAAGTRDSPYAPALARRQESSSVELISDDAVVRGRRVDPSSIVHAVDRGTPRQRDDEEHELDISALHPGASGYEGSEENSFDEATGHYDSDGGAASPSSAASEYPLPQSLIEGAPSGDASSVDPEATAYVQHPASHLISSPASAVDPDANASGWSGEGTANVESFTRGESTGIETRGESMHAKQARPARGGGARRPPAPQASSEESGDSRVAGRPGPNARSPVRGGTSRSALEDEQALAQKGRGRGTSTGDDLQAKARRHFDQALRDQQEGRDSRARMNAKLASVYDPHNEEYRAAVLQWGGEARRPATTSSKPREVELYEEAQRLEAEDEIDAAIVLLREGIGINPHIAAFHNRLGVILAVRKHEYAEAAASVRKAVELEPDNLHYKSNYGKIVSKAKMKGQLAGPP